MIFIRESVVSESQNPRALRGFFDGFRCKLSGPVNKNKFHYKPLSDEKKLFFNFLNMFSFPLNKNINNDRWMRCCRSDHSHTVPLTHG